MMVELEVRDHGDLGTQDRDRPVRLVTLHDEPALPVSGVPTELRHDPADDPRGIVPELAQCIRDHRGGRRLPMGSADDDRSAQRDELGQEVRA